MNGNSARMLTAAGGFISLLLVGMGALMLVLLTGLSQDVRDLRLEVQKIGAIEARVTNLEKEKRPWTAFPR